MRRVGLALAVLLVVILLASMTAASWTVPRVSNQSATDTAMTPMMAAGPNVAALARTTSTTGQTAVASAYAARAAPTSEIALVLNGEQNSDSMGCARMDTVLRGKQAEAANEAAMSVSQGMNYVTAPMLA